MRRIRPHLLPIALYLFLTFCAGWPLWRAPSAMLLTSPDTWLNSYILAWDQYALYHQIGDFFQANVYWPNADSLAYGELMLTQAIEALPLRLFGAAPALLHNCSLAEGFFFSALAAYALALFYFRSRTAATLAGVAYGFAAYRTQQSDHIQLVHGEFLPLMFLALEWILLAGPRKRRAGSWLLAGAALGQWLASWYWAVFTFWAFVPYAAIRLAMRRRHWKVRAAAIVLPLLIAALLAAPTTLPYLRLRSAHQMIRPEIASEGFSAIPADFLLPSPRGFVWGWMWRPDAATGANNERTLFPGLIPPLVLGAALAVWIGRGRNRSRRFPLGLWCGATLFLLSFCFGPRLQVGGLSIVTPYALLGKAIPLNDQVRVAARWILPALLGLAMLVGWGWRRWFETPGSPLGRGAGLALALLLVAESLTFPLWTVAAPSRPSALDDWINRQPYPSPTLLLPADPPLMMVEAAFIRQPLVNGTNGYFPLLHRVRMFELERFPADDTIDALRAMHVRLVAIDPRGFPPLEGADWDAVLAAARRRRPEAIESIQSLGPYKIAILAPSSEPLRLPDIGKAVVSRLANHLKADPSP